MKVLHVNAFDHKGGAARAAYRLHESLLRAGKFYPHLFKN